MMKIIHASLLCLAITACGEDPPAGNPPPKMPVSGPNELSTAPKPTLPPPQPVQTMQPLSSKPTSTAPKPVAQVTLTPDECKSAQKKLEALKKDDMVTKDSQFVYFVVKAANCDQRPPELSEAQRTCLSFPNYVASAFVTCVTP